MHDQSIFWIVSVDANSTVVNYGVIGRSFLPNLRRFTFKHSRIGSLIGKRKKNNFIDKKIVIHLITLTMMRSDEYAIALKSCPSHWAFKQATRLKKRWSGLGFPFFRMLFEVVSLKWSRPTVVLEMFGLRKSRLTKKKFIDSLLTHD